MLSQVMQQFQVGVVCNESDIYLFCKYFEDICIGDIIIIVKYIVMEMDIVNFVNFIGDCFYVYVDVIFLEGIFFEQWVVYGYWVFSKVVGLFVELCKGFVLLNYGLESCCFIKLVYVGMILGVYFIVKEKIE